MSQSVEGLMEVLVTHFLFVGDPLGQTIVKLIGLRFEPFPLSKSDHYD